MFQRCACDAYFIDNEHATYVREGVPLCSAATCQKVKEHREQGYIYYAGDDPGDEDRVGNEVHAKV